MCQNNILIFGLVQIEGPQLLQSGFGNAITKVGISKFLSDLFWVGMFTSVTRYGSSYGSLFVA